jgi:uncharacterized protein
MSTLVQISSLHVYPIKSCRGISLPRVQLTPRGFAWDREWMVVEPSGKFLTQREAPSLALVQTELTADHLIVSAPERDPLRIPLRSPETKPSRSIQVWSFSGPADDEGEAAATWWSDYLGRPARLVRWNPHVIRWSDPEWTGELRAPNAFSDGYPILVISEASLLDLNQRRQPKPALPMNRFRPNLVLAGAAPYAEDHHARLQIGDIELKSVKPCPRCVVTTTDQQTGLVEGKDPLQTLATYRRNASAGGVIFGQNVVIVRGSNLGIEVGQAVELRDPIDLP